MSTKLKLQAAEVYKSFPTPKGETIEVVRGLSFTVEDAVRLGTGQDVGEFFVLLGPSGCGKSTVLRMVAGLIPPDRGTITLDGAPIAGTGRERGMVFQAYTSFDWMTVLQNVAYGLKIQGVGKGEREQVARKMIQEVGLGGFEETYPARLSGGQKQRVAIARTLAASPKMILMDEPFGALDAMTRENLQAEIMRIWEETHKTILFVTHSIDEAVLLSDRVIVMSARPGRIVEEVAIDLPRPRTAESRSGADFQRYALHLRRRLGLAAA